MAVDPVPTRIRRETEPTPMRTSTIVVLIGALLFVLPIPGTFILGALVVLAGLAARLFGL
jgi:hypothetical protein